MFSIFRIRSETFSTYDQWREIEGSTWWRLDWCCIRDLEWSSCHSSISGWLPPVKTGSISGHQTITNAVLSIVEVLEVMMNKSLSSSSTTQTANLRHLTWDEAKIMSGQSESTHSAIPTLHPTNSRHTCFPKFPPLGWEDLAGIGVLGNISVRRRQYRQS